MNKILLNIRSENFAYQPSYHEYTSLNIRETPSLIKLKDMKG